MQKDAERIIINCYGVSDKELKFGDELYQKRLRRKNMRKFVDDHIIINPSKIDAALGAYHALHDNGFGITDEKALEMMASDGFVFAQARPGYKNTYMKLFKEQQLMESLRPDTVLPSPSQWGLVRGKGSTE
jgi:hypothetical protein